MLQGSRNTWNNYCKKASYKLHALRRLRLYLTVDKARLLAISFIDNHFNYAPLIWMFAGKARINSICKIYYRTLEVVYNNFNEKHSDTSIYQKHWQYLTVEVCKTVAEINPEFM